MSRITFIVGLTLFMLLSPMNSIQLLAQSGSDSSPSSSNSAKSSSRSGPISLDALIIEEKLQIPVFLTLERTNSEFANLKMTKHFLDLIIKSVEKNPF